MKKLLVILLSLCMVMCFMPGLAFADEGGLSTEQITAAKVIKAGEEITPAPEQGDVAIYKFTPEEKTLYNFNFLSNDSFEGDFSVATYMDNGSGIENIYNGSNGSCDSSEGFMETSNGDELEPDNVYYIVFSANAKCGFTSFKLDKPATMNADLKVDSNGKIYDYASYISNGKMVKVKKVENSGAWGTEMYIVPNKGYVFDGFYYEEKEVSFWSEKNDTTIDTNAEYDGKTIEAKFKKATAAEKKVRASKITKLKATATKGKITVTWKSSGVKLDGYTYFFLNDKAYDIKTIKKKSFVQKKNLAKGKYSRISVCGYKIIKGEKVYTDFAQVKVKAK